MLSIDDCSRCLRVSLQHEAFECFKGWKMYAEKVSEDVLDKQVASEGDSGPLPLACTQALLLGDRGELCSDLPPGVVVVPVAQPAVADVPYSVDETVFPMVCVPSSLELLQVNQTLLSSVLLLPQWKEAMYGDQFPGFPIPGIEDMVYRLQSALFGLMPTPRAWNKQIDLLLRSQLCCRSHTVDLGLLHFFFGLEVSQTQRGMCSQQHFVCGLLEVNGMENARSISTLCLTDVRGVWLRWLLAELRSLLQLKKMVIRRSIAILENPVLRGRTKWIGMQYYFVRVDGTISLEYCSPVDCVVDIFMKPLPQQLLLYCRCFSCISRVVGSTRFLYLPCGGEYPLPVTRAPLVWVPSQELRGGVKDIHLLSIH